MATLKVIIAGGGTGGHIFPAVAIAHALNRLHPDVAILFVGALGRMEMEKIPQEGFEIVGLDIVGFNRSNMLKNLLLPIKLLKSNWDAKRIIKDFAPDVVVGVGGYASFPVLHAAQGMGIPTLIQEQNSYAGKSNKILAKKAAQICVAYQGLEQFFPKEKLSITGNPVRPLIAQPLPEQSKAADFFGLDAGKKTLLIVGGSLGARSINEAVANNLEALMAMGVQIVWQTGKLFYDQALDIAAPFADQVKVYAFIKEMDFAYSLADLVISRAGALAIAELCIVGKPVVFVPYPHAAEDHQTSNAMALVQQRAALMIKDDAVSATLLPMVKKLLNDEDLQKEMRVQLIKMAVKNADEQIARYVIDLGLFNKQKS